MKRVVIALALATAYGADAAAQDAAAPPAHNPIFLSLAGPNAEPVIFRDVSLSTYQLLTGSVQVDRASASSAKATFAPFKLAARYVPVLSELAVNVAQSRSATTFGAGAAYNPRSAFSGGAARTLDEAVGGIAPFRDQRPGESDRSYDAGRAAYYHDAWVAVYDRFYEALARNALIVSAAGNVQTFGVIAADPVDVNQDGRIDNFYRLKAYDVSASITFTRSQATGATATFHYARRRASAAEGQDLIASPGWSASIAQRIKVLNPAYRDTSDYLKSLFVPSVVAGGSIEWTRCGGAAASCENALRMQTAITPFVDIRLSPASQFRIGLPVVRSVSFGRRTETTLAPAVQYTVQISGAR